jgi:hypothetical protein
MKSEWQNTALCVCVCVIVCAHVVNRFIYSRWYASVAGFSHWTKAPRGVFIIQFLFFNYANCVVSGCALLLRFLLYNTSETKIFHFE